MQQTIGSEHRVANQSIRGSEHSLWNETQNSTTSKRVLLPLEPDFSLLSDPSIVIGPPINIWQSTERHTTRTRRNRRDQPKTKHRLNKPLSLIALKHKLKKYYLTFKSIAVKSKKLDIFEKKVEYL